MKDLNFKIALNPPCIDMMYLQVITYRIFKEFALFSDSAVSLSLDFSTIKCVQPSLVQRFALCAAQMTLCSTYPQPGALPALGLGHFSTGQGMV